MFLFLSFHNIERLRLRHLVLVSDLVSLKYGLALMFGLRVRVIRPDIGLGLTEFTELKGDCWASAEVWTEFHSCLLESYGQ